MKNCDRRLVNAAFALRPRAAFSSLRSRFFTLRTDPEPFLSAVNWLTSGFAYATLSLNRLTRRLQNRLISNYFMLFAFSSTVNFSKIVFPVWNFVQSLKYFVLRTNTITVGRCASLDLRLFLPQTEYQIAWKSVKCIPQKLSQLYSKNDLSKNDFSRVFLSGHCCIWENFCGVHLANFLTIWYSICRNDWQ